MMKANLGIFQRPGHLYYVVHWHILTMDVHNDSSCDLAIDLLWASSSGYSLIIAHRQGAVATALNDTGDVCDSAHIQRLWLS